MPKSSITVTEATRAAYYPRARVTLKFIKPGRTRQEFKDECDLNQIMKRFTKHGVLPGNMKNSPQYLDVANLPDLQTSLHIMQEAQNAFMRLPAEVRKNFDHDAVQFATFAAKAENIDKLREWKLAPPLPEAPKPHKVEIVNPPAPPEQ